MQYDSLRKFRDRNKCEITAKNMMENNNCNCTYLHSATYTHSMHTHISILRVTHTTQGQHISDTTPT